MPERIKTIDPVTMPVVLNRMGMVSIAPPTMELNIASTVVVEELIL